MQTILPNNLIPVLLSSLEYYNANPTGIWRDFNYVYNIYKTLVNFQNFDMISKDVILVPPNPNDYSNLVATESIPQTATCYLLPQSPLNCQWLFLPTRGVILEN